jgi:N-acetylglucosaminyldiphosphoundecaprenol N-acetyl-beta-D-mannosaminyltransferase
VRDHDQSPVLPRKTPVLGVDVSVVDLTRLLETVDGAVARRARLTVSFVNPDYVVRAHADEDLRRRMADFDVMLADGWGVVAAARVLGTRLPTRLSNDDIGPELFALAARRQWRVFLFGSAPGIADRAAHMLERDFPGAVVAGTLHGYFDALRGHPGRFSAEDDEAIVEAINRARPDLLVVGLPTPLQQRWVTQNRHRLDVPVVMTGGSYLDHLTEGVRWYPGWVDTLRVGWLYRLSREPRRLWRRYSIGLAHFGLLLLREVRRRRAAAQ